MLHFPIHSNSKYHISPSKWTALEWTWYNGLDERFHVCIITPLCIHAYKVDGTITDQILKICAMNAEETYRWLSAWLQWLQCVSNGVTAVLHYAIDIVLQKITSTIGFVKQPVACDYEERAIAEKTQRKHCVKWTKGMFPENLSMDHKC